jgi:hypothetical protein
MEDSILLSPIPFDTAVRLCEEIRQETEREWHTSSALWCFTCQQETGGDMSKRGFLRAEGNRGCVLVNARFAELMRAN